MPRLSGRLASALLAAACLSGSMMLPMHGAMLGMGVHGDDSSAHGGSAHGSGAPAVSAVEHPLLTRCDWPLAVAVVTDDAAAPGARQAQRFALGAPSRIARALADASRCFLTLDPDPLLLGMPGGVRPDVMLRVRLERLGSPEPSLVDRAGRAVQSASSRYLGGKPPVERLERVDVTLQLVCAREKRVAAEFAAGAEGALHEAPLLREPTEAAGRENRERFAQAYAQAQTAAVAALRLEPRPCG